MSAEITREAFEEQVNSRMAGAPVPAEEITLHTDVSNAAIRPVGGFITACTLEGESLLYRPSSQDLATAHLTASHAMFPVGRHDEQGGSQGVPLWLDYVRNNRTDTYATELISMIGVTPAGYPAISRHFRLNHVGFTLSTVIDNRSDGQYLDTSVGERLYLDAKDEDPEGMRINDMTLKHLFGEGAVDRIMGGQAEFWPGLFTAGVNVGFSSGKRVRMSSILVETPTRRGLNMTDLGGMFIWHHQGTDSICIEPTFGVGYDLTDELRYNRLPLPMGSTAIMTTRLTLTHKEPEGSS